MDIFSFSFSIVYRKSWIDYQSTNINCAKLNIILTHQTLLYLFYHTILQCVIRHILIERPAFLRQCVRVGMFSFTLNVLGNSAQCPKIGQIFFIFLSLQSIGKSRMDYQSASTCCAKLNVFLIHQNLFLSFLPHCFAIRCTSYFVFLNSITLK